MIRVIGVLPTTGLLDAQVSAFDNGLGERGLVEGRNLAILFYAADGGKFDHTAGWLR
jgi:hypothetical protein